MKNISWDFTRTEVKWIRVYRYVLVINYHLTFFQRAGITPYIKIGKYIISIEKI